MYYHHGFFERFEKIVSISFLVDSPTRRVGESFFGYKFEAKIGTARNVYVYGTYAQPIYAKTPEIPPRCHVPLKRIKKVVNTVHWCFPDLDLTT